MKSLLERISANADELRMTRIKNAVELAADASFSEILKYKRSLLNQINDLEQSLDLGQTSTTDIATNLQKFDPIKWAERIHEIIGEIGERIAKMNHRIKVHNSLFPNRLIDLIDSKSYDGIVSLIIEGHEPNRSNTTRKK